MAPHKFHETQLIFVKNVPQESASSVASLYAQYKPLEVRNLYATSRITTLMIALPTADTAASALHRTDGMRVDSTIISVERYNAKQSTVARRETRKKHNVVLAGTGDDEYEADEWEVEEPPESWDDEDDTYVADEPVAVERKISKSDGMSWADVTRGKSVAPDTPSPSAGTPVVTAPQTPIVTPDTPESIQTDAVHQGTPRIMITPATLPPTPLVQYEQLASSSTHSTEDFHTASQNPTPAMRNESEHVYEDSTQATQISDIGQRQREPLNLPIDTTKYIRDRHCAGCAFCKKRLQGR
ncbi:hypothetical protein M3J07_005080 [Ascochyta lentis]